MSNAYRITVDGRNGIVRELDYHNSDTKRLVLCGFGYHSESMGFVDWTPGEDKVKLISNYLTTNNL